MDFVINRFLIKLYLKQAKGLWILINTVKTVFLLTCRVIFGKSKYVYYKHIAALQLNRSIHNTVQ